jgi:hypothetical protein
MFAGGRKMKDSKIKTILLLAFTVLFVILVLIAVLRLIPAGSEKEQGFAFIYMSDTQADPETGDYTAWGEI